MGVTGQLDHISEAIGALRSEVGALRRDIQQSDTRASESVRRADEHRTVIHKRVDDLVVEVGKLKTQVNVMDEAVKDSKTVTDEVKMWKQRGVGALFTAGIAGTAIGGAVVGFLAYWWEAIMRTLRAA